MQRFFSFFTGRFTVLPSFINNVILTMFTDITQKVINSIIPAVCIVKVCNMVILDSRTAINFLRDVRNFIVKKILANDPAAQRQITDDFDQIIRLLEKDKGIERSS